MQLIHSCNDYAYFCMSFGKTPDYFICLISPNENCSNSFLLLTGFFIICTEIKIEDAKNHVGDSVKICSKVYGGKYLPNVKGMPTFLNLGGNYPHAPVTIVIWDYARREFENPPEEFYKDVQICIIGRIGFYKGK